MGFKRLGLIVRRRRWVILELVVLGAAVAAGPLLAIELDFLDNGSGPHPGTIELDEALLLGGFLVALATALFSTRRYFEQKRESARRGAAEREIRKLAFQDTLTGLPNRRQFDQALESALGAPPRAEAAHGVFLLDLNGFKRINDVYGHGVGDEVLIVVARRLLSAMREGDLIARFGGDEFAVLAQHLLGPESAKNLARRIMQALDQPVQIGKTKHQVGVAVGIALLPTDATTGVEVLRKADVALYRAKAERRSAMRFFEAHMDRHIHEHDRIERGLRAALAADQVRAVFEPTIELISGRVVGFEVVPRWIPPDGVEVPPQRFIPVAEHSGLIHELTERLLHQACVTARRWPPRIRLAFDLYPALLTDQDLPVRILRVLAHHAISPTRLELEVTESALVRDIASPEKVLRALRAAGIRITLDHFGTGYSTLYHLRRWRVDKVKIDPRVIAAMAGTGENAHLVGGLVGLGRGLGLTVAAGGIGSAREVSSLRTSGCREGQGAWVGAPMSAQETLGLFPELTLNALPGPFTGAPQGLSTGTDAGCGNPLEI